MIKDIYIVHTGEYIGAFLPAKCPVISYAKSDKFVDFCLGLREDFPDFRLHCVINKGIEEKVQERIRLDKLIKEAYSKGR